MESEQSTPIEISQSPVSVSPSETTPKEDESMQLESPITVDTPMSASEVNIETQEKPCFAHSLGIDFGSQEIALAQASCDEPHKATIIRNQLSHDTTTNTIAFHHNERFYGENADSKKTLVPGNCFNGFTLLLKYLDQLDEFFNTYPDFCYDIEKSSSEDLYFKISNDDLVDKIHVSHCISYILKQIKNIVQKENKESLERVILALPDTLGMTAYHYVLDACKLADLNNVSIVSTSICQAYSYGMKLKTLHMVSEDQKKNVLFVDQGHSFTDIYLVEYTNDHCKVLLSDSITIGAKNYDIALYNYFKDNLLKTKKISINPKSKQSLRLLSSCGKLKEVLSGVSHSRISCGGLNGDEEITLEMTRSKFEDLCKDDFAKVESLLRHFKQECESKNYTIDTLEVIGGGCRVPYIKSLLSSLFDMPLSFTVDSASCIARGAAMLGVYSPKSPYACSEGFILSYSDNEKDYYMSEQVYKECQEAETKLMDRDLQQSLLAQARNDVESLIGDTKSAMNSTLGQKYLDSSKLDPILQNEDDYLLDHPHLTIEELKERKESLLNTLHTMFPEYYKQVQIEKEKFEKELELASQAREKEIELHGKEDHDDRKLTTAARLIKVEKNKKEGNDLFKDKNYAHAASRYIQALTHCGKFFDLNEEDKKTVEEYRLTLYLNLAQCYIKLEKYEKAIENANYALKLDENNVKALYRRALCLDKQKKYIECKSDVQKLLKLNPNDVSVKRLAERNALEIKKIEQKRKEMAKRMFQ